MNNHLGRELNGWERLALDWILDECCRGGTEKKILRLDPDDRFIYVTVVRGLPGDEGTFTESQRQSARFWIGRKGTIYARGLRNPRHRRVIKKQDIGKEFK